jgi:cardiolipin synthase A/B
VAESFGKIVRDAFSTPLSSGALMTDWMIWLPVAGYFLTWLLIPWVLLRPKAHPSAAVAWIMVIIFMPFAGALLCGIFGGTHWKVRERKQEASSQLDRRLPDRDEKYRVAAERLGRFAPLDCLGARLTGAWAAAGNHVEILDDTRASLEQIEEIIKSAQKWVHIEFYIWRNDNVGKRVRDLLIEKAREGVEVRFLYDGIGSMLLTRKFFRPLQDAGIRAATFTPGLDLWHLLTLNFRNHRKLVIADGRTALTGGMNLGEEYLRRTRRFGDLRDTQVYVEGPAVLQFQEMFAQDWFYATGEELIGDEFYPQPENHGRVPAQVVADGPDNDVDSLYALLMAALGLAEEQVTIATPYFIPPEGLAMALETAALRGVRVRLLVARRGNFTWTLEAGRSYYEPLLNAGVEIWEYQKGLFHGKTFTVDGAWSLVGSTNWDYRGFYLNFEVSLAIFDHHVAAELEKQFDNYLEAAERIDPDQWRRRSTAARLHEQFWRIFAPAL